MSNLPNKDAVLRIRVPEAERNLYVQAAETAELTLSEWARQRLRKSAKSELRGKLGTTPPIQPPNQT